MHLAEAPLDGSEFEGQKARVSYFTRLDGELVHERKLKTKPGGVGHVFPQWQALRCEKQSCEMIGREETWLGKVWNSWA